MCNKDTQIVETALGQWLRFPNTFKKSSCLVELSNQISLNIDTRSGKVHVHEKDHNQVYRYVGEIHITTNNSIMHCSTIQAHSAERSDLMFSAAHTSGKIDNRKSVETGESA
ncbi:hypothetical protein [Paenibacillus xerothermodurans]|uniref:hypothetical protein n=1 Tax=Paenibacillus xerothermodurans TaxID=1977292 RepID=UPI001A9D8996|nr:hypothetical protein [Paenibacillus xerothermodurans]